MNRTLLCFTLLTGGAVSTAAGQTAARQDSIPILPAGKGTLNQDFITLRFSVGALDIRFTPLSEAIIRLLAADGYKALSGLQESQQPRIDSIAKSRGIQHPGVALVSFFGTAPNTRFDPKQLAVLLQGRRMQPIGVIPISPSLSNQQLAQREQASGLLIYEQVLPATQSFNLAYLNVINQDWANMLSRLDAERARILGTVKRDSIGGRP